MPRVDDLPFEILSYIFCCLLHVDNDTSYLNFKLPPTLILRSVCRRWLAVTEATAELWPDLVGPCGLEWTRRALSLCRRR